MRKSIQFKSTVLSRAIVGAVLLTVVFAAGCNEFIEDDLPTDVPRRPRLAERTSTAPAATRIAVQLSPADQQRADEAIDALKKETVVAKLEAAIKTVMKFQDPRGPAAMMSVVRDGRLHYFDEALLGLTAESLARYNDPDVTAELVSLLGDGRAKRGEYAAKTPALLLARMRDPRAVDPLIKIIRGDKKSPASLEAVEILGQIGGKKVVDELLDFARGTPGNNRWFEAVCTALGNSPENAGVPALVTLWHEVRSDTERMRVLESLRGKNGTDVVQVAQEAAAYADNRNVRKEGVDLIAGTGSPEAWAVVVTALGDEESNVRSGAALSMLMGTVAAGRELEMLRLVAPMAHDKDAGVQRLVSTAIAYHLDAAPRLVVETLLNVIKDKKSFARHEAADGLKIGHRMKPDIGSAVAIREALLPLLDEENFLSSLSAAGALVTFGEKDAVAAYLEKREAKLDKDDFTGAELLQYLRNKLRSPGPRFKQSSIVDEKGLLLEGPAK